MFASASLSLLLSAAWGFSLVSAAVVPHDIHDHAPTRTSLPSRWYHEDDHPAHKLFKRGQPGDGVTYASVGSPEWSAPYPQSTPNPSALPQVWVDALNAAVAAGTIPNIPPSTLNNGNPVYPNGLDALSDQVCSSYSKCNKDPNVVWNAPDGVFGIGFDDGPQPASDALYTFLQQNNERATHFFIGVNIIGNPNQFNTAFQTLGDDIAVHTWTHPYMTTLSNLDVLGQLGWTVQLIHNSTGGRLPRYWRPPYGDSDKRVAAIAKEVFGMTTIVWNQDTEDWSIPSGGTTNQAVQAQMTKWFTGPKSPGLIILEHELYNQTVQAFINAYPLVKANGWKTASVATIASSDGATYQNAKDSTSSVTSVVGILPSAASANSSTSSTAASNPSSSPASSGSSATSTPPPSTPSGEAGAGTALQQTNGATSPLGVPSSMLIAGSLALLSTAVALW
ncbi:hypothetical protein EIP91_000660 [Steccherinum ochraceum]|uniref:chitin deacetylase n=1 Tax=Steccherinum ochraceum TaxID=92696 RepID=A0A4R0RFB1_9APHY|nr:hypothetical protein EIP91_000660 [Steccherinum ochraceum]